MNLEFFCLKKLADKAAEDEWLTQEYAKLWSQLRVDFRVLSGVWEVERV